MALKIICLWPMMSLITECWFEEKQVGVLREKKVKSIFKIAGKPYYQVTKNGLSVKRQANTSCPLKYTVTVIEEILAGLSWAG